jgi:hypothetical protein
MRPALVLLSLFALVLSATAEQNPDIRIYLDADPPNGIHEIDPAPSTVFDVYVCLDSFGSGGGTRGTAFLFIRNFQAFKLGQTNLLGGLDFGDVEVDGWTAAAGADCVMPDPHGIVVVGRVEYLFVDGTGTVTIVPHPGTGRAVLDCDFLEDDQYDIGPSLVVGSNPVERVSWGAVKALYR